MHKPGVEEIIPGVFFMSHPADTRTRGKIIPLGQQTVKSTWLNGLRNRRVRALPKGWWMNELPPPLRSSSEQDSFPSLPPGFLRQEEKGEKQALSPHGAQQGQEQRSPPALSLCIPVPAAGCCRQQLRVALMKCNYICRTLPFIENKDRMQVKKGTQLRFNV